MKKSQILGIVRHVLTFGGGFLIAKGIGNEALIQEVIAALMVVVGGVWSMVAPEKKQG